MPTIRCADDLAVIAVPQRSLPSPGSAAVDENHERNRPHQIKKKRRRTEIFSQRLRSRRTLRERRRTTGWGRAATDDCVITTRPWHERRPPGRRPAPSPAEHQVPHVGHKSQHSPERPAPERPTAAAPRLTISYHRPGSRDSAARQKLQPMTACRRQVVPRRSICHTDVVPGALLCSNAADHLISYPYTRTRTPNE